MKRIPLLVLLILGCAHVQPAARATISREEAGRLMEAHRAYWLFRVAEPVNGLVVEEALGRTFLYKKGPRDTAYVLVRRVHDFIQDGEMVETQEDVFAYHREIQTLAE